MKLSTDGKNNERPTRGAFVFCLAVLVAADQALKYFIPSWQNFKNYNFAFSLPVPVKLMYGIYSVILIAIFYHLVKNYRRLAKREMVAWMLIVAGAISNVGERIVLGYVRDYIYIFTGIFNLADGYIVLGIVSLLLNPKFESRNSKNL